MAYVCCPASLGTTSNTLNNTYPREDDDLDGHTAISLTRSHSPRLVGGYEMNIMCAEVQIFNGIIIATRRSLRTSDAVFECSRIFVVFKPCKSSEMIVSKFPLKTNSLNSRAQVIGSYVPHSLTVVGKNTD
jgi:hypothetical protein